MTNIEAPDRSVFIVEDDLHFRETFVDIMALRGVKAQGAGTGAEALAALKEAKPDVIVLDVKLPDVHGFDLCKRIRRVDGLKKTPVIFLSASTQYNDSRDRAEGLLAGASLFLPKPITMDKLWAEIETLLSRPRP